MSSIREQILRSSLHVLCETKQELHRFIKVYLGLDLPDVIVCDDEPHNPASNSSPMDLVWEVYDKARKGDDPKFQQVLAFASRGGGKTLSASVIETLCLIHLRRDVVHLSAIEPQSKFCLDYITGFLRRPILKEYISSVNRRNLTFTRYESEDGLIISPVEFAALTDPEKEKFTESRNEFKIAVATVESCNGLHAPFVCMDELDITDPNAFAEAKNIPTSTRGDRKYPITLYTSTRKYSFGLVQKEIDRAEETNLQIRHFNIIDNSENCPPSKHKPEEPKVDLYVNQNILKSITKDQLDALPDAQKLEYEKMEGYAGCAKCKLFSACLGRLATKQTSKSPILRKLDVTENDLFKGSIEMAKSQLMCWKPSTSGLVFPTFDRMLHMLPAYKMANMATGEEFPENLDKRLLIELFKELGAKFVSGVDWGFTHHYSVVTGAILGNVLFIFDVIAETNKEILERIDLTKEKLFHLNSTYYPDNAYPSDIATYKKAGFRMVHFEKDTIKSIESLRTRLFQGLGRKPSIYFLLNDPGVELLVKQITRYHWKMDKNGDLTDEPDRVDDDVLDALRYMVQNVQFDRLNPNLRQKNVKKVLTPNELFVRNKILELTGKSYDPEGGIIELQGDADFKFTI